jgi:hypothetical protein
MEGTEFKVNKTVGAPYWIYALGLVVGLLVMTIIATVAKKVRSDLKNVKLRNPRIIFSDGILQKRFEKSNGQ